MPRRTRKVHMTERDAVNVAVLALLIEDRTDGEQESLVRLCEKLDRADVHYDFDFDASTWAETAESTRLGTPDSPSSPSVRT